MSSTKLLQPILGLALCLSLLPGCTTTPTPECSIDEPTRTKPVVCPSGGQGCVFTVQGTSTNVKTDSQAIVIFVDPGGDNWWPQNLDFGLSIEENGDWAGQARIGPPDAPPSSGARFRVIALVMKKSKVPKVKRAYKPLPRSIASCGPVSLEVE
jgi:hypothetical protein